MKIDQIIRSNRKTIAIVVQADGKVIVRAPLRAAEARIMAFVAEKQAWIEARLARVHLRQEQTAPRRFADGETLPYLGRQIPLQVVNDGWHGLRYREDVFVLSEAARAQAEQLFTAWYRKQARRVIEDRVHFYAQRHHLEYARIRISSARTRWGSCSSRGTLSFSWRLVMAPPVVLDYVVVHELAHLIEHNHSRRFWEQVSAMMPDYQQVRAWLKTCGGALNLEYISRTPSGPCNSPLL